MNIASLVIPKGTHILRWTELDDMKLVTIISLPYLINFTPYFSNEVFSLQRAQRKSMREEGSVLVCFGERRSFATIYRRKAKSFVE